LEGLFLDNNLQLALYNCRTANCCATAEGYKELEPPFISSHNKKKTGDNIDINLLAPELFF